MLLFGGSFDPVHLGHLFIADAARLSLGLERVLFVPVRAPRHRDHLRATPEHRLAMLRGAVASNPAFAIDETDMAPDAGGYSVDLLHRTAPAATRARTAFSRR